MMGLDMTGSTLWQPEDSLGATISTAMGSVVLPEPERWLLGGRTSSKFKGREVEINKGSERSLSPSTSPRFALFQIVQRRMETCIKGYWDNYVWLIMSASVGFALTLMCIKVLSESVSVFQVTAVRGIVSCAVLFGSCWWNGVGLFEPRDKIPLIMARAVTGAASFVCVAVATFELPLSESAFMANSYPVVTAVLSWIFAMEHLGLLSWSGVIGCVIGNALMAHPPFIFGGGSDWGGQRVIGIIAAITGNCLTASAFILLRHIGKSVDSSLLTAYMHLLSVFVSVPFLVVKCPKPLNLHPSKLDWLLYTVTCITGILGQVAQSRALQIGPPTKTTTLLMTNMLIAGLLGVAVLNESVTWLSGIGAGIIVVSVMLVSMQSSPKAPMPAEECQSLIVIEASEKASNQGP